MIDASFTREELDLTVEALKQKLTESTELHESNTLSNLVEYLETVTAG